MRPLNLGGADAVYVEDNTFDFSLAASTVGTYHGISDDLIKVVVTP